MDMIGRCIESQAKGVFYGWIETSKNRNQFAFKTRYILVGDGKSTNYTFSITLNSIWRNCNSDELAILKPEKTFVGATRNVTCTVNPKATITVTINTSKDRRIQY